MNCELNVDGNMLRNLGLELVPDSEVNFLSKKGANFMGEIISLTVQKHGNVAENPEKQQVLQLVLKKAIQRAEIRKKVPIATAYQREIYIYSHVLPVFEKMQLSNLGSSEDSKNRGISFNSYPKLYGFSSKMDQEMLLLQDMRFEGYKNRPKNEFFDLNHCKLVIIEFAKLHALSLATKLKNPEEFEQISANCPDVMHSKNSLFEPELEKCFLTMMQKAANFLDEDERKIYFKIIENISDDVERMTRPKNNSTQSNSCDVLLHSDPWTTNVMFKYDKETQAPISVCLLDWQWSCVGPAALDLLFFLFTSASQEVLDSDFDFLLETYASTIGETLQNLCCDPAYNILSKDQISQDMRKYCKFGLSKAILVGQIMFRSDSEALSFDDMVNDETMFKESLEADIEDNEEYGKRIRGVIKFMLARKWF